MPWSTSKPADSDKLSASAGDLRTNFAAIANGNDSFTMAKLPLTEQGSDPTNAANLGYLYTKEDSDTNYTELYFINSNGDVVQITDTGRVGNYSTGTWTPDMQGATSGGSPTYSIQTGRYTKIGNLVTIQAKLTWSSHPDSGETARLTGLPFTISNNTDEEPGFSVYAVSDPFSGLSSGDGMYALGVINQTYIQPFRRGNSSTNRTLSSSGGITIFGSYYTSA